MKTIKTAASLACVVGANIASAWSLTRLFGVDVVAIAYLGLLVLAAWRVALLIVDNRFVIA